MSATPLRANLFDKLTGVYAIRRLAGSGRVASTVNANAAAGATALTLASAADAADKDILIVGSGEEMEAVVQSGAPSGAVCTIFTGLKKAHVVGETVAEGVAYDLGEVAGMKLMDSAERADLVSDVSRSPYGSRLGFLTYGIGGRLQSLDAYHVALALGLPFTSVLGAATSADPTQITTDGDDIGREPTWFVAAAIDEDGNTVYVELDACDADYTKIAMPLSQGPDTGLDVAFYARMHPRFVKAALNFTPDVSKRVTKSQYPESLLDVGLFEVKSGGLSTTTTAATTVGGNTVALTAATAVAGGSYYLVSSGRTSQIIWVESLATLTATLRTRFKYVFPSGSTVVELQTTSLGGAKQGSTQFTVGGSVRPVKFDQSRVQAGVRPGTTRFSLNFAPVQFSLQTLRRRLGLPSGAVSGSILTVSDLVGTDSPVGCYAKVQKKDGTTAWIYVNSVENTLEQLELGLQQSDMWSVPLSHVGKQVTLLQY